jgi:hypothetical protein
VNISGLRTSAPSAVVIVPVAWGVLAEPKELKPPPRPPPPEKPREPWEPESGLACEIELWLDRERVEEVARLPFP